MQSLSLSLSPIFSRLGYYIIKQLCQSLSDKESFLANVDRLHLQTLSTTHVTADAVTK